MKKYTEPKISLLVYVEEDILTESVLDAQQITAKEVKDSDTSVTFNMSKIIELY